MKKNFILMMALLMSVVSSQAANWQPVDTNIQNLSLCIDKDSIKQVKENEFVYAIRYNKSSKVMKIAHIKSNLNNNHIGVIAVYDYDGTNYKENYQLYSEAMVFMKPVNENSFLTYTQNYIKNGGQQVAQKEEVKVEEQKIEEVQQVAQKEEVKVEEQKIEEVQQVAQKEEVKVEEQKIEEVQQVAQKEEVKVEEQKIEEVQQVAQKEEVKVEEQKIEEVQQVAQKEEVKVSGKSESIEFADSVELEVEKPVLRGENSRVVTENNIKYVSYEQKCEQLRRESMATNLQEYADDVAKILYSNWKPAKSGHNTQAIILLNIGKDGSLLSYRFAKASGDSMNDRSIISAIEKSVPFPRFSKIKNKDNNVILQFVFDYKLFRKSVI